MAATRVRLSLPSPLLFKFPPASLPEVVLPPNSGFTYPNSLEIPPKIYNHLLSAAYPVTVALVYTATVTYLNQVNRQNNNRPWPVSKTAIFFLGVVLHNILLAVYSGWMFMGMLQAFKHSWPGIQGEYGFAGAVDALCKINGPRGLGNGVIFNSTTNIWTAPNAAINVSPQGIPDNTDLGRIWNEGLAFYGWFFYLSKLYETLDTVIILLNGKAVSPLQIFHHAGAMISVWAGIRYMSPPMWFFVFLNSGVHTLMYTYYALKSLSVPVPRSIKKLITRTQITQFIVGTLYAFSHFFISYSVPTSVPASIVSSIASGISAVPAVATSIASSAVTSVASAASSAGIGNILRKVALRAAGEEGLAENVPLNDHQQIISSGQSVLDKIRGLKEEVTYTTEYQMTPCIDTSGQAFAIWLNLLYLVPLTYLFIQFFSRSYANRTSSETRHPTQHSLLEKASRDAAKGIARELDEQPVPLPEQTKEVAKQATRAAERVVSELEKEAANVEDGEGEEMPGTYDGQNQKVDEVKSRDRKNENKQKKGGTGDQAGKPEQQTAREQDVTKRQQNNKPLEKDFSLTQPSRDDKPMSSSSSSSPLQQTANNKNEKETGQEGDKNTNNGRPSTSESKKEDDEKKSDNKNAIENDDNEYITNGQKPDLEAGDDHPTGKISPKKEKKPSTGKDKRDQQPRSSSKADENDDEQDDEKGQDQDHSNLAESDEGEKSMVVVNKPDLTTDKKKDDNDDDVGVSHDRPREDADDADNHKDGNDDEDKDGNNGGGGRDQSRAKQEDDDTSKEVQARKEATEAVANLAGTF